MSNNSRFDLTGFFGMIAATSTSPLSEEEVTFKGGDPENSFFEEFDERKKYKMYEGFNKFKTFDTFYKDYNYGLFKEEDGAFYPVSLVVDVEEETLENFPDYAPDVRVIPFVAKAFKDFRAEYSDFIEKSPNNVNLAISHGLVDPSWAQVDYGLLSYPKYLDNVVPKKGYVNFDGEYNTYLRTNFLDYFNEIETNFASNLQNIKPWSKFMKAFMDIYERNARHRPLTKSGFSISPYCSIMTTGLCIELAELDYDIDGPKGEMITSTDYLCFADYVNSYGFRIDKNAPWRIIADIDSPEMKQYIIRGKPGVDINLTTEHFNDIMRSKNAIFDLEEFKRFIGKLYVEIHGNSPQNLYYLSADPEYSSAEYWQSVLIDARSLETGYRPSQEEVSRAFNTYRRFNLREAKQYVGKIFGIKLKEIYGSN